MTPAVVLGLSAALCWGCSGFLGGLQSRHMPALTVALWSQLAGVAAVALVLFPRGDAPAFSSLAWGVAAGLIGAVAQLLFYRGLAVGLMSIVAPISACGAAVPVVVALGMGEVPSRRALAGIAAILAAIVLVSLRRAPTARDSSAARTGVAYALGAALGFGTFFVVLDLGSAGPGASPVWAVGGARLSLLASLLLVSVVRPPAVRWPGRRIGAVVAAGLTDTLGTVLFAYAARQASLGIVAVLGSLYPVVTVLLGRLLLTERLTPIQHTGVGLALGGVALLAGG